MKRTQEKKERSHEEFFFGVRKSEEMRDVKIYVKKRKLEDGRYRYSCALDECENKTEWKCRESANSHARKHLLEDSDDEESEGGADNVEEMDIEELPEVRKKVDLENDFEDEGSDDEEPDEEDHAINFQDADVLNLSEAWDEEGEGELDKDFEDEDEDEDENENEDEEGKNQKLGEEEFSHRNHPEQLQKKKEDLMGMAKNITPEMEAFMWFRKLTLLRQVPNKTSNLILQTPDKMALLQGLTIEQIDKKVKDFTVPLGFKKTLNSGVKIRYIPIPHSLLASLAGQRPTSTNLFLYWDGFRRFRAKGGSTGFQFFLFFFHHIVLNVKSF